MAIITPNIGVGTTSLASPLITPGWPMASVPASNPIAGNPGTTPGMNATDTADLLAAATEVGNQANRVL
jgi:hypothetical protein